MKKPLTVLIILSLLAGFQELRGQTLTFLFKNARIVSGSKFQYEIWVKSNNGSSRMGEILVYMNHFDFGVG